LEDLGLELAHEQERGPVLDVELEDQLHEALHVLRLERLEEAVDDDELGLADEGAREGRQAASARADLPREGRERLVVARPLEEAPDEVLRLLLAASQVVAERERHVLDDRAVREERSALEDGRRARAVALVIGEAHGVDVAALVED